MVTPNGRWTVETLATPAGEVFLVRERAIIGTHGGAGWAPIGKIRRSVAEVLGHDFAGLVYKP